MILLRAHFPAFWFPRVNCPHPAGSREKLKKKIKKYFARAPPENISTIIPQFVHP
jgi:hypothetical protein